MVAAREGWSSIFDAGSFVRSFVVFYVWPFVFCSECEGELFFARLLVVRVANFEPPPDKLPLLWMDKYFTRGASPAARKGAGTQHEAVVLVPRKRIGRVGIATGLVSIDMNEISYLQRDKYGTRSFLIGESF